MAGFDALIEDVGERFDLDHEAHALVQEVASLIAAQPDGIDGFLDKFNADGLEEKTASWLDGAYPMALSAREVNSALGAGVIERIAQKAGVTHGLASKAAGYAIPKIIGLMSPHADSVRTPPARDTPAVAMRSPSPARTFAPPLRNARGERAMRLRLIVPGAALLATFGIIGYAILSGTSGDGAAIQTPAQAPSMEAQNAPVAFPAAASSFSRAGDIHGDLAVKSGWIDNLSAAFGGSGSPDALLLLTPYANAPVPQFVLATMTGGGAAGMRVALSTPKQDSSGGESSRPIVQAAVDFPVIIFPPDSAKVPLSSIAILRRVAGQIKQLPPGTVVQLNGYTHGTLTSAAGMALSQRRADSVSRILVHEGVSPAMLSAKGYGSAGLSASNNGTAEGRSSTLTEGRNDRRVDFSLVQKAH